jgi:hypothetical protein
MRNDLLLGLLTGVPVGYAFARFERAQADARGAAEGLAKTSAAPSKHTTTLIAVLAAAALLLRARLA